jgi:hypothetical protein
MSTLRYFGFDQRENTRSYVFQYIIPGAKPRPIVVSAEIPLLVKYHVRIQDGPALCLHMLMAEVQGFDFSQIGTLRRLLTVQDLLVFVASHPQPTEVKGKREKPGDVESHGPPQ